MVKYNIIRSKNFHESYEEAANEYLIKFYIFTKKNFFMRKLKRLRLVKELTINQLTEIQTNLCYNGWVCLSKSEKDKETVKLFLAKVIESVDYVTDINLTKP